MANREDEDFISHFVTGSLNPGTQDQTKRPVNLMDKRYRTYIIDFEIESGIVMLPISLGNDLNNEIDDYAILIDNNHHSFEIKVDRMDGCIVLTTGCSALRDFYNINTGVWITLVYMGLGKFRIKKIKSKTRRKMVIPVYDPPMRFEIDRNVNHGALFHGICESVHQISYRHNPNNFCIYYEKLLHHHDIISGFLMLEPSMFREQCLEKKNTDLTLIDDNGNKWKCRVIVGSLTQGNWRIGGPWKTMIDAHNIKHKSYMIIGAPIHGIVDTAFFRVKTSMNL